MRKLNRPILLYGMCAIQEAVSREYKKGERKNIYMYTTQKT